MEVPAAATLPMYAQAISPWEEVAAREVIHPPDHLTASVV
jgi:hypothetical protein